MADVAQRTSQHHQAWIIETLREHGNSCQFELLVRAGADRGCDNVGTLLRLLKSRGVVDFPTVFLADPDDNEVDITLLQPKYDPTAVDFHYDD